ncbi:hypothetical protein EC991_006645 [Linnemannia zychae]|nr:hypothetical protein EC991_006645 [Linnemannia zychae]
MGERSVEDGGGTDDELSDAVGVSDDNSEEGSDSDEEERGDGSGEDERENGEKEEGDIEVKEESSTAKTLVPASRTMATYSAALVRWRDWCTRKRYTDGDTVTRDKLIKYAQEATARETYVDEDNPHLNIEPFMTLDAHRRKVPSSSAAISGYFSAVRALYKVQELKLGRTPDMDDLGTAEITDILIKYKRWHQSLSLQPIKLPWLRSSRKAMETRQKSLPQSNSGQGRQSAMRSVAKGFKNNKSKLEAKSNSQVETAPFQGQDKMMTQNKKYTLSGIALHPAYREWCARKGFLDGERVTREKAGSYAAEIGPTEAHEDKETPHLSIRPLVINSRDFPRRAAPSTITWHLVFLRKVFLEQCQMEGYVPNMRTEFWPADFKAFKSQYHKYLESSASHHTSAAPSSNGGANGWEKSKGKQENTSAHSASKDWCTRKRFKDGDKVTSNKLIAYVQDMTAEKPYYDKNNPHLNIEPFFTTIVTTKALTRQRIASGTVRTHISAIRVLYREQCLRDGVEPSDTEILTGERLAPILLRYKKLLKKEATLNGKNSSRVRSKIQDNEQNGDEQGSNEQHEDEENGDEQSDDEQCDEEQSDEEQSNNCNQDIDTGKHSSTNNGRHVHTDKQVRSDKHVNSDKREKVQEVRYSMANFKKSMNRLWAPKITNMTPSHRQLVLQDRLRMGLEFFTCGSGHNPDTVLESHLHLVRVESLEDPSRFTTGVAMDKGLRKSHANRDRYSILLREKDVEICPVGALAFYLLAIWTDKDTAPNFCSWDWENNRLLSIKSVSKALGNLSPTSTDALEATLNDSRLECLTPLFHSGSAEPYMFVGTLLEPSAFQLPRSKVIPPVELQRQLFPFVEELFPNKDDWKIWIDNVMIGRPEDTNRPKEQQECYPRVSYPAIRLLLLLAQLRKIILQDYAVLMAGEDDRGERRLDISHTFAIQHPVFSTADFQDFALRLRDSTGMGSAQLIRKPAAATSTATATAASTVSASALASSTTHTEGEPHPMDEESVRHRLVQQGIPLRDFERPLLGRYSTDPVDRLSPTKTIEWNNTASKNKDNGSIGCENSDCALLRPVLRTLYDKIESLQREKKELVDRNRQLQDQLNQVTETPRRPVSGVQGLIYDASLQHLRDRNQELREKMTVLEEEKREAFLLASEAIKVTDALNERVTELQEMVEGMWSRQEEAEDTATT